MDELINICKEELKETISKEKIDINYNQMLELCKIFIKIRRKTKFSLRR